MSNVSNRRSLDDGGLIADRPNDGFLAQLDIFYQASYKVSKRNKVMRMYYLERALDEIMREPAVFNCPILMLIVF